MSSFTRVRLKPKGPFHFGGRGVGMEHSDVGLPADSLFSALCVTLADLGGAAEVEDLLARFSAASDPAAAPFRLTSLMPCAGDVYLLPYPMIGLPDVEGAADMSRRKLYKRIGWASEKVFAVLARGERPDLDLLTAKDRGDQDDNLPITVQSEKAWVTRDERGALQAFEARNSDTNTMQRGVLWRSDVRPRVAVDRVTSASAVYAAGVTQFNLQGDAPAGLYTVIEWLDAKDTLRQRMRAVFDALGDTGIGGERSSGFGKFEVADWGELSDWEIGAPQGGYFTTLSPYLPRREERDALGPGARYEIVLRRGWLSLPGFTNVYRGTVRLLAEGSVLLLPDAVPVMGQIVDITPKRVADWGGPTIYRYGLAFPVRVADQALRPRKGET